LKRKGEGLEVFFLSLPLSLKTVKLSLKRKKKLPSLSLFLSPSG
jgi:hypothetical protein